MRQLEYIKFYLFKKQSLSYDKEIFYLRAVILHMKVASFKCYFLLF